MNTLNLFVKSLIHTVVVSPTVIKIASKLEKQN